METEVYANDARGSVLAALAWFDVFGYPLTAVEAARFSGLFGPAADLRTAFSTLSDTPEVMEADGHYRLSWGQASFDSRRRRFRLSGRKLRRARRAASVFGLLPSVRLVAACNSLAVANAEKGSDIDLFLVCRPGTLWRTRLFLAGTLKALGLRPTPENQRDRLCLSFFVSEDELDLSGLALPGGDPYLRWWIESMLPLYDAGRVYERLRRENGWVFRSVSAGEQVRHDIDDAVRHLSPFERMARRVQSHRFPPVIRDLMNRDTRVVVRDDMLKFHVNDRRERFRDEFERRLDRLVDVRPVG